MIGWPELGVIVFILAAIWFVQWLKGQSDGPL